MTRRTVVNVATFLVVSVLLAGWAATSFLAVGPFAPERTVVTARFAGAPGLQPDFDVAYLGHSIGRVGAVRLEGDAAVVTLEIEPGLELPRRVRAAVRRKSAVGEPYVDLRPPGDPDAAGGVLAAGDVIPRSRTSVPVSYQAVFRSVNRVLSAVPADALGTLVHELAVGVQGRGEAISTLVTRADDLVTTLARDAELLGRTVGELSRLTDTLAARTGTIESGIDATARLAAGLRRSRGRIAALLDDDPGLVGRLAEVVGASRGALGCALDALGPVAAELDPVTIRQLDELLATVPALGPVIGEIGVQRRGDRWIRLLVEFATGAGPPVRQYEDPPTLPEPPPPARCGSGGAG